MIYSVLIKKRRRQTFPVSITANSTLVEFFLGVEVCGSSRNVMCTKPLFEWPGTNFRSKGNI